MWYLMSKQNYTRDRALTGDVALHAGDGQRIDELRPLHPPTTATATTESIVLLHPVPWTKPTVPTFALDKTRKAKNSTCSPNRTLVLVRPHKLYCEHRRKQCRHHRIRIFGICKTRGLQESSVSCC